MNNIYYSYTATDGFGSQYQKIIESYISCKCANKNFAYTSIHNIEHNYNNDSGYASKLENLMNIKNNIININENMEIRYINYSNDIHRYFSDNIDRLCESEHMKFIKDCFWANKERDFFKNGKINVAVQIRRENYMDRGQAGERASTPNIYYLNIMNQIRKNKGDNLLFHIYSQGDILQFKELENNDVVFHLNEDIVETFIGMVAADKLVISPSSFSYVAALISDGEIYYKPFWHNPRKEWVICR